MININSQTAANIDAVTPSDATRFGGSIIYCGGAGNLVVEPEGAPGQTRTIPVVAGSYLLCRCTKVLAATTATGIFRLY